MKHAQGIKWCGAIAALAVIPMLPVHPPSVVASETADRASATLSTQVNSTFGLARSELVHLDVDTARRDAAMQVAITFHGRAYTLDMRPHSSRSGNYKVYHSDANGNLTEVEPRPVNTLRGVVLEDHGSLVAAAMMDEGLYGRIIFSDGEEYWFEPVAQHLPGVEAGLHVVYHGDDVLPHEGRCIAMEAPIALRESKPSAAGDARTGGGLDTCELAIDADSFYFDRWGDGTEDRVNLVIDQMDIQYNRDVGIDHVISTIIIRTVQVYESTEGVALLNEIRERWLSDHRSVPRDIVQAFTGRNLDGSPIGYSWIGEICASPIVGFGFGLVQSDFNQVLSCATDLSAHELGHSWNADHCNCNTHTMNAFITCANRFHPSESIPEIITFRDSRTCLNDEPPTNDDCDNAPSIGDGAFEFDCTYATTDGPDIPQNCRERNPSTINNDIWYEYRPPCNGVATASLCDSDFDTRIAVYEGDDCVGALLACNDDHCGEQSEMSFDVRRTRLYRIRVGSRQLNGGVGTLILNCGEVQTGACCYLDGTCAVVTVSQCQALGGTYNGDDSLCDDCPVIEIIPLALEANWNGVVHAGEAGAPDAPAGYRSIGDRGLVYGQADALGGAQGTVDASVPYILGGAAEIEDAIYIGGPRNAAGHIGFDDVDDDDHVGIAPVWDPSGGTTVVESATTDIDAIAVNEAFALGMLYNSSYGGGTFDLTLGFESGLQLTARLHAPDWFADFDGTPNPPGEGVAIQDMLPGPLSDGDGFLAAMSADIADPGLPLNVVEAVLTYDSLLALGEPILGERLTSLTFDNTQGGTDQTVGIYAATIVLGAGGCPADIDGSGDVDFADILAVLAAWSNEGGPEDIDGSGFVDFGDLLIVLAAWGPCE